MKQIQNLDINDVSQKQKDQTISKANYGLLNSPKKRTKCTQDNHSFFGRIKETINCFRDLLTFIKS